MTRWKLAGEIGTNLFQDGFEWAILIECPDTIAVQASNLLRGFDGKSTCSAAIAPTDLA